MGSLGDIIRNGNVGAEAFEHIRELSLRTAQDGHIRQSIESLRYLLDKERDPFQKSKIYLTLAKHYRILLRMKNARYEINRAFEAVGLIPPRNTVGSVLRYFWTHGRSAHQTSKLPYETWLYHLNELFVEMGLSGYYLRENLTMIQASFYARYFASLSKHPIFVGNWYGGTGCLLRLMGWKGLAARYMRKLDDLASPDHHEVQTKFSLWRGLYHQYNDDILKSVSTFEHILYTDHRHLSLHDLRLVATTLSCQYLIRGFYQETIDIFNLPQFKSYVSQGYSGIANSIDWYKIFALKALGREQESQQIIDNHKYVLSYSDEDSWAVTLYIGQCLLAQSLSTPDESYILGLLKRFDDLHLKPNQFFTEAAYIWVGKSRCLYKLYMQKRDKASLTLLHKSLDDLETSELPRYLRCHGYLIRYLLARQENDVSRAQTFKELSRSLAMQSQNKWVLQDLERGDI